MNRKYPLNIKYFGAARELFDFIKKSDPAFIT